VAGTFLNSRVSRRRAAIACDRSARVVPTHEPRGSSRPAHQRAMKRGPPWGIVLTIAVVVVLLLEGIPIQALATPVGGSSKAPTPTTSTAPATPTIVLSTTPDSERVRAPTSGPGYQSLCLLGVLRSCAPLAQLGTAATTPLAPDPVSSWTQITPPSGQPNPAARYLPAMTYDPSSHDTLLFGGAGCSLLLIYCQDTWSFVGDRWTELISPSSCTAATCPSIRASAMMAPYAPLSAVLLFGGEVSYGGVVTAYNDTWLFYSGAWHNISATAGPAPSPRFGAAMTWDSADNQLLLFGGALASGQTLGDTWTFNGTWHNISASLPNYFIPIARAGAAITNSPSGYLFMFGGEQTSGATAAIIQGTTGTNCGFSLIASWFYQNRWLPVNTSVCLIIPRGPSPSAPWGPTCQAGTNYGPCGRVYPALGWSPKNEHFALYGGYGPTGPASTGTLNDTWTYSLPPGDQSQGGYNWRYAGDTGDPSNRTYMGYANDFTDNYFIIFGGCEAPFSATLNVCSSGVVNETWRFYEIVHAQLTGPSSIDTNSTHLGFNLPFTVTGYGGTGALSYAFSIKGIRAGDSNTLIDNGSSTGCAVLRNQTGASYGPLPYVGTAQVFCSPTPTSYNVYRETVHVWDENNVTDAASASWTFTVLPPQTLIIYSEYTKYFYEGFDFNNIFGVYVKLAGEAALTVTGTLGGLPEGFQQRGTNSYWWNSSAIDMGHVSPGSVLEVTANWNGWSLNASYTVPMISTPDWLTSLFDFSGAVPMTPTYGAGPYNKVYAIYENYSWSISSGSSSFALPSPLLSGDYSIIPSIAVSFSANSAGSLAIAGTLSVMPPSINFGVVSIQLTIAIGLTGNFQVVNASQGISDVQWGNVQATLTLSGDLGASIPIYGFDVLGVSVGFTLKLDLTVALALTLLLLPTTPGFDEIIPGVQMKIAQLLGAFTLGLSAAVYFGIGIAAVGIGIATSIALAFNITPTFHIGAGWFNGTFFANATFLWWNVQWNIVGPGVIYAWVDPPTTGVTPLTLCPTCYNNGANATWKPQARYYATGGYDENVWNRNLTQGPAVSDIYPHTEVSGAPGYNGGYLFYSDDNASVPVEQGLHVSGLRLDPSTNGLSALRPPSDPGFVTDHPQVTTLPDGSLYVVWVAVPSSETSLSSPADLTSLPLHGARFYPSNQSWGPVRSWTSWGFAEAYQLGGAGSGGTLVALIGPSFLTGTTAAERLVEFDIASGREVANVSVTGLSEIPSVSAGLGEAVVQTLGGNFSVLNLTTGATVPASLTLPPGSLLISESFATNAPSTLVLLFRSPHASEVVLYDLASDQVIANRTTDQSASTVEALYGDGIYYIFEEVHSGVQGWTESDGTFANLTQILESNLESFGLVQVGSSILVYSLVSSGNGPNPTVTLDFAEVGATLAPVGAPARSSGAPPSSSGTSTNYALYLGLVGAAVAVLLAVVAILTRRRPPSAARAEVTPTGAPPSPTDLPPSSSPAPGPPPPGEGPG
jgi:hypothetical protein